MCFGRLATCSGLLALLALGLCGCLPPGSDPADEQKEPHFLAGKTRVKSLDFRGAIESFEKALEVNPRSASAHFELGWLFNEKEPDPAAAIYHFEKCLKLNPNFDKADWARQRIDVCKQDLARAVLPLPVTPSLQRDFDRLLEENKRLKEELAKWQGYAASQPRVPTNSPTPVVVVTRPNVPGTGAVDGGGGNRQVGDRNASTPQPVATRTHTVQSGESLYTIAKRYGVKLDALKAANPKIDPKRLKVGQTLNVPAR